MKMAIAHFKPRPKQWAGNLSTMLDAIQLLAEGHPAPDLIVLPGACDSGPVAIDPSLVTPAMCQGFRESVATIAREWGVWIACGQACSHGAEIIPSANLFDPDGDAYIRSSQFDAAESVENNPSSLPSFVANTPIGMLAVATPDLLADPALLDLPEQPQVDLVVACCPTTDDAARCEAAIAALALKWQANLCIVSPAISSGQQPARVLDFTGKPMNPLSVNAGAVWFGRIPLRFGGGRIASRLAEEPPTEEALGFE